MHRVPALAFTLILFHVGLYRFIHLLALLSCFMPPAPPPTGAEDIMFTVCPTGRGLLPLLSLES